jgi:hypothetical protein
VLLARAIAEAISPGMIDGERPAEIGYDRVFKSSEAGSAP